MSPDILFKIEFWLRKPLGCKVGKHHIPSMMSNGIIIRCTRCALSECKAWGRRIRRYSWFEDMCKKDDN